MKVRVKPRLQVENWSLYWKESLQTQTQCLDPIELDLSNGAASAAAAGTSATATALPSPAATVADLLSATATALGWPPAASLHRLDGFTAPWERVLAHGRELPPEQPLYDSGSASAAAAAHEGGGVPTFTVVRVALKADGWKIRQPDDFLTDSDNDSDAE